MIPPKIPKIGFLERLLTKKPTGTPPVDFTTVERPPDQETPHKCLGCGKCCQLYKSTHEGGSFPEDYVSFDVHCDRWMAKFVEAGVLEKNEHGEMVATKEVGIQPLHDPKDPTQEPAFPWVDINLCQFCHPVTGCMIPRPQRPELCNRFLC